MPSMLILIAALFLFPAQQHKKPVAVKHSAQRQDLSESFAKAGLKAVLAIGDWKGTGDLSGRAADAYENAMVERNDDNTAEVTMAAELGNYSAMRSLNNMKRQTLVTEAATKLYQEGKNPEHRPDLILDKIRTDPDLSARLAAIEKQESKCSSALEKAFRKRMASEVSKDDCN